MKRHVMIGFIAGILFLASNAVASEINLNLGETYSQGDLTVTCGKPTTATPLALKDCQYWNKFNKKCLFEKTTYVYKSIECVEECQNWDEFFKKCHYQTKCRFYPAQESFVQTTCNTFDHFNKACVQASDTKIGN